MKKFILLSLFYSVIILIFICFIFYNSQSRLPVDAILLNKPQDISSIHLINHRGKPFTTSDFKNQWTFLFFGFTNCEMICPTTLTALNKVITLLKTDMPKSLLPQVLFITIDPERDTINRLNQYITSYNKNFIAARTNPTETIAIEKQFSIVTSNQNGTINHSTEIILINPRAQIQAYFRYPQQPDKIAKDYKLIVEKYNQS